MLGEKNPCACKILFRNEGNKKIFSDEGKLREFVTSKPTVKEMLKEVLVK